VVPVKAPPKSPGIVRRHPELRWLASALLIGGVIVAVGTSLSGEFRDKPGLRATGPEQLVSEVKQPHAGGYVGTILAKVDLNLPHGVALALAQEVPVGGALLDGSHTMRYWYGGETRQRIAIIEQNAEQDVFRSGDRVLTWDTGTRTFERHVLDGSSRSLPLASTPAALTPPELAQRILAASGSSTTTLRSGDEVAGRSTYELVVQPKSSHSLIGSVHMLIDGDQSVPLAVQIYPRGSSEAAIDVAFTSITFGAPQPRNFTFTPPAGARVRAGTSLSSAMFDTVGSGWLTVAGYRTSRPIAGGISALFGPSMLAVHGSWGSGQVYSRGALSVLVTRKGQILVGAVDPSVLYRTVAH
jgi:outer membrane lipoprotein-sorting protein